MVVIDTNALIWWVTSDKRLSKKASKLLNALYDQPNSVIASTFSTLEIAMLISKSRLVLGMDIEKWIEEAEKIPALQFEAMDNITAIKSTVLPEGFHRDPADRVIVALARKHGLPLITSDDDIHEYKHVKTIW